jgi:photosystem II stability/assembly factor-like uncharacterized protein
MRRLIGITALATVAVLAGGTAAAQLTPWTTQGPTDVGWVLSVAIGDSAVYAGTLEGVFRSADRGATWQTTTPIGYSQHVRVWPGTDILLAGGGFGGLAISQDGGQNWTFFTGPNYPYVGAIVLDLFRPGTAYASVPITVEQEKGIWRTTDFGVTWESYSDVPYGLPASALAVDSTDGTMYLVAADQFHKSLDAGASWIQIFAPIESPTAIATGPDGAVYAGRAGEICRSTDAWTTSTCAAFPSTPVRIVEIPGQALPSAVNLLVASQDGLFTSSDGGGTWTAVSGELGSEGYLEAVDADSHGLVLAGTASGIYRSEDRGLSWARSSQGLRGGVYISSLVLDPRAPDLVWAGSRGFTGTSGAGLFRSEDAGASWSRTVGEDAPRALIGLALDPSRPSTLYAGGGAVHRTDDGGAHWTRTDIPDTTSEWDTSGVSIHALAVDPEDPDRVFATTGGGLYRSDDRAETFHRTGPDQEMFCLLFDGRRPGTIYAGSYADRVETFYGPYLLGGRLFTSTDSGATLRQGTFRFESPVTALAVDPFREGVVYAGVADTLVYTGTGYGSAWEITSYGLPLYSYVTAVVADPVRPGHLYAGTSYGVYRSTDFAANWLPFTDGLFYGVETLVITPDGRRLHAGTRSAGVFELDLEARPQIPCAPEPTRLCLTGGRYSVELLGGRRGEFPSRLATAHPVGDRAGYFGFPFATGDANLPEIVVKMPGEGALGINGSLIFYSSLTTLPYMLIVTDTATGDVRVYRNGEKPLCGAVDVAFDAAAPAPAPRAGARTEGALSLLSNRFAVTLSARHTHTGAVAAGRAIAFNDRSGYFSLPDFTGDAAFPEVFVKMIDFSAITGNFWVFYTGLTSLDYTLTVTDTETGAVRTYDSAGDYCGNAASDAFVP